MTLIIAWTVHDNTGYLTWNTVLGLLFSLDLSFQLTTFPEQDIAIACTARPYRSYEICLLLLSVWSALVLKLSVNILHLPYSVWTGCQYNNWWITCKHLHMSLTSSMSSSFKATGAACILKLSINITLWGTWIVEPLGIHLSCVFLRLNKSITKKLFFIIESIVLEVCLKLFKFKVFSLQPTQQVLRKPEGFMGSF